MYRVQFFITLFHKLLLSDVNTCKKKGLIFTENSACDSVPVLLSELTLRKVCAENRGKSLIEASIYNVINARNGKLIYHLGSKIVDDKQIAIKVTLNVAALRVHSRAETAVFVVRNKRNGGSVNNVEASLDNSARNRA
jgi:hypothetical protein